MVTVSEVHKKIGIEGKEKTKIHSIDIDTFVERIKKINETPVSELQKLINPKIVDLKISKGATSTCHMVKGCKMASIEFELLFAYNIINYRKGYNYSMNSRKWTMYLEDNYPDSYFGRKAGILFCKIDYSHHTKWHTLDGDLVFRNVIHKTPWSLLQPPRYKGQWGSINWLASDIDKVFKFRYENEPTIANYNKWIKYSRKLKLHKHTSDIKSCSDYNCIRDDILKKFEVHPHYLDTYYCIGDQDSQNISFKSSQKKRNAFAYINAVISTIDRVNVGERGMFSVFSDVFEYSNLLFDNKLSVFVRELMNGILGDRLPSRLSKKLKTVKGHKFNAECYCYPCLSFRGSLVYGMKFDKDKLLMDVSPTATKQDFQDCLDYLEENGLSKKVMIDFCGSGEDTFLKVSYTFPAIMNVLLELDPLNDKYQIKKSMLDFSNSLVGRNDGVAMRFLDNKMGYVTFNMHKEIMKKIGRFVSDTKSMSDTCPFPI